MIRLQMDDEETILGPGERASVPPGRAHAWSNVGDGAAQIRVEVEPALRTEMLFETSFGLAKDGRTNRRGLPNLLSLAVIMQEYDEEMRLARPPAAVQRAMFWPFALLGRRVHYRGWYSEYTSEPLPRREA